MAERLLRLHRPILVLLDVIWVIVSFYLAWYIRYELQWYRSVDPAYYTTFRFYLSVSLLTAVLIIGAFYLEGVYKLPRGTGYLNEFYRLLNATTTVTIILMVGNYMFQPPYHSRLLYVIAGVLILALTASSRLIIRQAMAWLRRRGVGTRRVLLVGAGEVSRSVMRALLARPNLGYSVVGFLDDNPEKGQRDLGSFSALGSIDNLSQVLIDKHVDEVIVTLPWQYHRRIMRVLSECEKVGARTRIVPDVLQLTFDKVDVEVLDGIPLLGVKSGVMSRPELFLKRAIDIVLTAVAMIVLLPLMALVALAIKLDSPGPAIFAQKRVGKDGKAFTTYKFRSMITDAERLKSELVAYNEADGPLFKMRDDPRMTRVGRWLRRFSLDELPQVINVLRGDMSLVGPRPALPTEVEAYEPWHLKRLEAMPGITGMWQISGRSDLSFDEMVLLDIYYVENWSPSLDFNILLRTVPKVLLGEGAY